jgi:hypothetical protein
MMAAAFETIAALSGKLSFLHVSKQSAAVVMAFPSSWSVCSSKLLTSSPLKGLML